MKIKLNIDELLYLDMPLFLLGLNYVLYNALGMESTKIILRIGALLLMVIGWVLKGNFSIEKKPFFAMAIAILAFLINGSVTFNFLAIVIFSICVTYPIEKIALSAFRTNLLLVILMIILMALHVVNNTSYISTMGRSRATFGFENPNVAALFYSSLVYLLLVSRKKLKPMIIGVALFLTVIVYYYTNSRTSLLALLVFVFLEYIVYIINKKKMLHADIIFGKCAVLFSDALFLVNLLSVFTIEKFMRIDQLLSFRISTFSKMIDDAGLIGFLFGGTTLTVDSFYYMLLFQYGIFIYLFVAIATHFALKQMVIKRENRFVSLIIGLLLVAMMESSLIRPEILVTLVVWKIIFSKVNVNPVMTSIDGKIVSEGKSGDE
ncbi:MAG: hypothetical protein PHX08_08350 [Lachnospiraceae bacterium]|nr:hypothetical protein [Lachnospiraceae bacterium]